MFKINETIALYELSSVLDYVRGNVPAMNLVSVVYHGMNAEVEIEFADGYAMQEYHREMIRLRKPSPTNFLDKFRSIFR